MANGMTREQMAATVDKEMADLTEDELAHTIIVCEECGAHLNALDTLGYCDECGCENR